ncbi:MAG TPA: L-threonine 3-dehydrogenase [Candidatus Limnocylindrales bacterium]|jgi:threonine 3-dehydrogenase|nr:L-threonine 3-dehydrogenase [Candidatus Limnocylindrales bacterium]
MSGRPAAALLAPTLGTTMRALVKESAGPGAVVREVPLPEPGPMELLVRVDAASVCGTDVHIERWDPWAQENFGPPPMTFGHEMAGTVVAHGPGAGRVRIGDTIAAETHIVDWSCYQCRTGRAHVCQALRILGVHVPGSFAEYAVIPEQNAWVYEGLPAEIAALQEPMGNAVHAIFVEEVAGQNVAVLGCGPIGLMALAVLRVAGARRIFATDVNPERLALAERMGADVVIDARDDVAERLRSESEGNGVDVVLEMSGAEAALHQGLAALTNGGRISLLGTHTRPATIDLSQEIIFKGIRVHGITGRRLWETWYRTTALLEEGVDLSPIITHRLPLSQYQQAFDLVASGHAGKVVLLPQEP